MPGTFLVVKFCALVFFCFKIIWSSTRPGLPSCILWVNPWGYFPQHTHTLVNLVYWTDWHSTRSYKQLTLVVISRVISTPISHLNCKPFYVTSWDDYHIPNYLVYHFIWLHVAVSMLLIKLNFFLEWCKLLTDDL